MPKIDKKDKKLKKPKSKPPPEPKVVEPPPKPPTPPPPEPEPEYDPPELRVEQIPRIDRVGVPVNEGIYVTAKFLRADYPNETITKQPTDADVVCEGRIMLPNTSYLRDANKLKAAMRPLMRYLMPNYYGTYELIQDTRKVREIRSRDPYTPVNNVQWPATLYFRLTSEPIRLPIKPEMVKQMQRKLQPEAQPADVQTSVPPDAKVQSVSARSADVKVAVKSVSAPKESPPAEKEPVKTDEEIEEERLQAMANARAN